MCICKYIHTYVRICIDSVIICFTDKEVRIIKGVSQSKSHNRSAVSGLSPGNLIPEAHLIPLHYTVTLCFLFLHILIILRCWKPQLLKFRGCALSPHDPHECISARPKATPSPQRTLPPTPSAHRLSPVSAPFPACWLLPSNLALMLTRPALLFPMAGLLPQLSTPPKGRGWCNGLRRTLRLISIPISSFYTSGKRERGCAIHDFWDFITSPRLCFSCLSS